MNTDPRRPRLTGRKPAARILSAAVLSCALIAGSQAITLTSASAATHQRTVPVVMSSHPGDLGTYLCTRGNLPAQCADLLNDSRQRNSQVIMDSSTMGLGLGWNEANQGAVTENWPFTPGTGLNNRYFNQGANVFMIEKTIPGGHDGCMASVPNGGTFLVQWLPCDPSLYTVLWVQSSSNYWINVDTSDIFSTPYGMSDVQGTNSGSEITVDSTDNPWDTVASPFGS
jgi:hypothetical protein